MDIKRMAAASPKTHQQKSLKELSTVWGDAVDPENMWPDHPRPQFARQEYTVLNGYWDYAIVSCEDADLAWRMALAPERYQGKILVPFSPEAPLSGVRRTLHPDELLWYRRTVSIKPSPGKHVMLHFGAVDYACSCYVNGQCVGVHVGGYLPFAFDITGFLSPGETEITLCVYDPSETGTQLRGKQRLDRGDIWYTAQSGIWQTVWLEEVPALHLVGIDVQAIPEGGRLVLDVRTAGIGRVSVDVKDAEGLLVCQGGADSVHGSAHIELFVEAPRLWSPEDPFTYSLELAFGSDRVTSYCAFRQVEVRKDDQGTARFFLNGKPYFVKGVLDQGYWPDGLMTAPSADAMRADISAMKKLGFNMLRKHIKVEPATWYYLCDTMGMLVWQDMVSGGGQYGAWATGRIPTLLKASWTAVGDTGFAARKLLGADDARYRQEWELSCLETIAHLKNHPSVATWVLFNEGWGQFNAADMARMVHRADPTRPIDATSGWYDQRAGSYFSVHNYFRDLKVEHAGSDDAGKRAFVISECGGLTWRVEGHSALEESYGYATFETAREWFDAVTTLLATCEVLQDEGLAGFVYTQLSDVEEETNGLLTYDRRVNKLAAFA